MLCRLTAALAGLATACRLSGRRRPQGRAALQPLGAPAFGKAGSRTAPQAVLPGLKG